MSMTMDCDATGSESLPDTAYVEKCRVYFDDLDAFGMLHAGRYYALVERGITACVSRMGFQLGDEDVYVVAREMKLTFGAPIRRIGEVELVFWMSHIGRSSATFDFIVKSDEGDHARGYRSITKVDPATGRSAPWTDAIRAVFSGELPSRADAAAAATATAG
ncbi:acyl-CoA thioesterase [Mycolicibacter minnesotensis]